MEPASPPPPEPNPKAAPGAEIRESTDELTHQLNTTVGSALLITTTLEARLAKLALLVQDGALTRTELDAFIAQCSEGMRMVSSCLASAGTMVVALQRRSTETDVPSHDGRGEGEAP
jgi:hypothetical protein